MAILPANLPYMRVPPAEPASNWIPIAAYAVLSASNQMLWLTFTPLTTDAAAYFGVSVGAIGWLAQIFPLLYIVLALPAGRVIDRWLPHGLALGAALTGAGAVIRLGDAYGAILAGQIVIAIGQPLVLNSVTKLSGSYLRREHRAIGIAVSSAGIFAGMMLALALGTALGGDQIHGLLVIQAVVSVITAASLCAALVLPRRHAPSAGEGGSLRAVWTDPYIRILTGMVLTAFGLFIGLTTWLEALLERSDVPQAMVGWMLLAMVVAGVAGSSTLPQWIFSHDWQFAFIGASAIVAGVGCLVLALIPGVVTGFVVLIAIGILLLTDLPLVLTLAEQRAGSAGATATGLLWMAGNLGGLVVAVIVELLVHQPTAAFCVLAACMLPVVPLLSRLRRQPALAGPSA